MTPKDIDKLLDILLPPIRRAIRQEVRIAFQLAHSAVIEEEQRRDGAGLVGLSYYGASLVIDDRLRDWAS